MQKVAIIMGSDSDFPVMEKAVATLKKFEVEFELRVMSAHRTPLQVSEYLSGLKQNNIKVVIAAAGKAAHLAGAIAAHTTLPVIGVPIKSSTLDGLDALLSTVQMPAGVPVATVAIDGAQNAAVLAVQILAVANETLAKKLEDYKTEMAEAVIQRDKAIQEKI